MASSAYQLTNPVVTASARPFNTSFLATNLFDAGTAEFASLTQGEVTAPFTTDPNNGTWVQFDFGTTVTIDRFAVAARQNAVDVVETNRLILSADPTFDSSDTIVTFTSPGVNGQGFVRKIAPVSGRYARWEVISRSNTGRNLGGKQMWFLNSPEGHNLLPAPAVINSAPAFNANYLANFAVNGDAGYANGSEYASLGIGAGMFIDFDFGASIKISGFDFWNRVVDRVTTFNLVFADTPDFNSPVATLPFTADLNGNQVNSGTFAPVIARYVRLQATGATGGNNTGVREIQFYTPANQPPFLIRAPQGATRLVGDSMTFSVGAAGEAPLYYQWFKGTEAVAGATNSVFTLTNLAVTATDSYSVVITNAFGSLTSPEVALTVIDPPVDITSELRAWYQMDDASFLFAGDVSGNELHGFLQGFYDDDTQWVEGRIFGALRFNAGGTQGSNEVVIVSDPSSLLDFSASPEFTLTAWVKGSPVQEEGGAVIARGTGGGGEQYSLDINGGAYRFFVRSASGAALVLPSTVRPNGTWQHVVAVYSRTLNRMKLYVNTVEVASATPFSTTLLTNQHEVSIGSRQVSTNEYNLNLSGVLDDVRVYARPLTPSDVAALYYDAPPAAPVIVQQPQNTSVALGTAGTLSVVVDGTVPLSYQWFKGAAPIAGATNVSLVISNAQITDDADYRVVITNLHGTATSELAHLTVIPFLNLSAAPVQVSSVFNATFPGTGAFDRLRMSTGPNTARWASATVGAPHWIYVDLGQDTQLEHVWLDWETASGSAFTLRIRSSAEGPSNNPDDWHTVASVSGYAHTGQGIDGADVMYNFLQSQVQMPGNISAAATTSIEPGPVVGRYLMLHAFPTTPTYAHVSVWEIQVKGNRLAIAPTVTLNTTTEQGVTLPVAELLSKTSDLDGDAVTLVSVGANSTNGAPVNSDGSTISFTPASGFSGADAFEYVVTDGHGINSTGRVEVLVYPGTVAGIHFSSTTWNNNSPTLTFEAIAGRTYQLQRATAITGPWTTITNLTAPGGGIIQFTDPEPAQPSAFYRVKYP